MDQVDTQEVFSRHIFLIFCSRFNNFPFLGGWGNGGGGGGSGNPNYNYYYNIAGGVTAFNNNSCIGQLNCNGTGNGLGNDFNNNRPLALDEVASDNNNNLLNSKSGENDPNAQSINRGTVINIPIHQYINPSDSRIQTENDPAQPKLSVTTQTALASGEPSTSAPNQYIQHDPVAQAPQSLPPPNNLQNPNTNGNPSNQNYVSQLPGNNNLAQTNLQPSTSNPSQSSNQPQENRLPPSNPIQQQPSSSSASPNPIQSNGQISNYVLNQESTVLPQTPSSSQLQISQPPQPSLPLYAQNYGGLVSNIVLTQSINTDGNRFPLKSLDANQANQASTDSKNQLTESKQTTETTTGSS